MNNPEAFSNADLADSISALSRNEKRALYKQEWTAKNSERHKCNQKIWHKVNKEVISLKKKAKRKESPLVNLRDSVRGALKRKGGDIDANFMLQMWFDQDGYCAISGLKMVWGGGTGPQNLSIDRIDPTVGYYKGNVRLVCHAVNSFRGQMSDDDLLKMAIALVANMQAKKTIVKISQEACV